MHLYSAKAKDILIPPGSLEYKEHVLVTMVTWHKASAISKVYFPDSTGIFRAQVT